MNEKTNDEVENNNSMAQQENVDEKLDQEKDQENKILAEESLENNETAGDEEKITKLLSDEGVQKIMKL